METKRLVAVGIEGPQPDVAKTSGATLISAAEKNRSIVVFGLVQRDETDIERALRFAFDQGTVAHRIVVKEVAVSLGGGILPSKWKELFESEISHLSDGDILVSAEIAKIYERLFLFERVAGEQGDIFFLRGERKRPARLRGLKPGYTPIVGRSIELQRLLELAEQASVDQGQIAGIVGEAGIGKTRLLFELKAELQKRSVRFIEGNFLPNASAPYAALRSIVINLAGPQIETLSRWEMTESETDFLRLFLHPGVRIERLVGMSQEEVRQGLFFSVRKLIHAAAKTPLVLIFEDLHWADQPSLDLLNYVFDGLEETKLLMVLAHRPEVETPWPKRLNYTEIRVTSFEEEEVDRFVRSVLHIEQVPIKFRRELLRLSVGNPLFIEELLRQLLDNGSIRVSTEGDGLAVLSVKDTTLGDLPTTLHALIASRFDRLPSVAQETLKWAALFGSTFDIAELEALAKDSPLDELSQKHFIREKSAFPKRLHQFTHDLIFETVQRSLGPAEKEKRHTRIGEFLHDYYKDRPAEADERIAGHLLQGTPTNEAIDFAIHVGKKFEDTHQLLRALSLYQQAVSMWGRIKSPNVSSDRLFMSYTRAALTIGQMDECEKAFKIWEDVGVAKDPRTQGAYQALRMTFFNAKGDSKTAFEASENAMKAFRSSDDLRSNLFDIMHDRIHTLINFGRNKDAIHEGLMTLKEMDGNPAYRNPSARLWARLAFCISSTGNPGHAVEYVDRAMSIMTPDAPPSVRIEILNRYQGPYFRLGKFSELIKIADQIINTARETGLKYHLARNLTLRAIYHVENCDYLSGLRDVEESLIEARSIHDRSTELGALTAKIDISVDLGSKKYARELWNEFSPLIKTTPNLWNAASLTAALANLLVLEGQFTEAASQFQLVSNSFRQLGHKAAAGRNQLWKLFVETKFRLRPIEAVGAEFEILAKNEVKTGWKDNLYQVQAVAMVLDSNAFRPVVGLDLNLEPKDCPNSWLRQLSYVAKIEYLDAQKKFKEADELRAEYTKVRATIAEKVPPEFREDFMNHPIYRVPSKPERN